MTDRDAIDLTGQPYWRDADRSIMPGVEPGLLGIRTAVVGWIGRLRAGVETYAPVPSVDQGGTLELGQAQVRHLHAEFGKLIEKWDTEPRDLVDEVDSVLGNVPGRQFLSRAKASSGYEVETDGGAVYVYYHDGRGRSRHLGPFQDYAHSLEAAGYTGPDGAPFPEVERATDEHPTRVHAIPPAAESF